jgi:transcriptional regulator with XRE-family HTH domain
MDRNGDNMPDQARSNTLPAAIAAAVAAGVSLARAARESIGYSIEDLAVACGLTADEITQVEVGNDADPGRIRRIAAALGIPEDAIFQETAAEPRQAAE